MRELSTEMNGPVYHRQRLLLFFLEYESNGIDKLDIQKLLMLYTMEQQSHHYAFVPFHYGCYSFLCADDLSLLKKEGWIVSEGNRLLMRENLTNQKWAVRSGERETVHSWLKQNPHRGNALIAETYRRYPYYAVFSKMKERLLTSREMQAVVNIRDFLQDKQETEVFTIGYEGILFEDYLNKLIRNRIATLCDVRHNPVSRKFGFSGKMLSQVLPKIGIKYVDFPELGIESEKRKNLDSQETHERLFREYRQSLPNKMVWIKKLKQQIDIEKRVALTCFEKDSDFCHRHCITDMLESQYGYPIKQL